MYFAQDKQKCPKNLPGKRQQQPEFDTSSKLSFNRPMTGTTATIDDDQSDSISKLMDEVKLSNKVLTRHERFSKTSQIDEESELDTQTSYLERKNWWLSSDGCRQPRDCNAYGIMVLIKQQLIKFNSSVCFELKQAASLLRKCKNVILQKHIDMSIFDMNF
eukprot:TRINITY_DN106132_c0_g1_i1.p1 TRINITY_DN106132_c0_g1~~TRINITY_DN106132_c0_g1_i1.p1  ORF type:complete len:161 (-),score=8.40 TRINITY_DN106132_c0_g1_i1:87-569(-)